MKSKILRIVASAILVLAISVAYGGFSDTAEAGKKGKKANNTIEQPKESKAKGGKYGQKGGPNLFWD